MPLTTFTFVPSYTTELTWQPDILSVRYGDGYAQEMPDGINSDRLRFNLVFQKVRDTDAASIVAFIRATGGTIPFLWTPPAPYNGAALMWKCKNYQHSFVETNANTLILPFIQDFNPS